MSITEQALFDGKAGERLVGHLSGSHFRCGHCPSDPIVPTRE